MLLSGTLEQIIDKESADVLWVRAGVAALAAVTIFVGGILIALVLTLPAFGDERWKLAWSTVRMSAAPAGIAASISTSLVVGAGLATVVPKGTEGWLTALGGLMLIGGYALTRGLWVTLWRAARSYYTTAAQGPSATSPPSATGPSPAPPSQP